MDVLVRFFNWLLLSDFSASFFFPENADVIAAFLGAFSAFSFFVCGEYFFSSLRRRAAALDDIAKLRTYTSELHAAILVNQNKIERLITNENKPISINFGRLLQLPKLIDFPASLSGSNTWAYFMSQNGVIVIANDNVQILNEVQVELSNMSRIAMLERKEDLFEETLAQNRAQYMEMVKSHGELLDTTISEGCSKMFGNLAYSEMYITAFFWKKWYLKLRGYLDPKFREKWINQYAAFRRDD